MTTLATYWSAPNLTLILVTLALGWLVLWPARGRLGAPAYHISALPVGLLAWPMVAAVTSIFAARYSHIVVLAGLAGFAILGFAFLRWATRDDTADTPVRIWTFAAWGLGVFAVAIYFVSREVTVVAFDSYMFYETYGVWLHDTGLLSSELVSSRSPLLPALSAANRWLGGDWLYAVYPVMAAHLVPLVAYVVFRMSGTRVSPAMRAVVAMGAALLMGASSVYLAQLRLVHSHTASALFIALSIAGILVVASTRDAAVVPKAAYSWATVAGLATAGLILARPDGLAYAFIPASLFVSACVRYGYSPRMYAAFFAPAVGFSAIVLASTFARYGLWVQESKLGGSAALLLLVLLAAMPLAAIGIQRVQGERLSGRDLALGIVLLVSALGVVGALLVNPQQSAETLVTMRENLLREGGNGPMWYFLPAVLIVSVLAGLWIENRTVRWLTVAFLQFFAVAVAVHVLAHPGRIGWGDSFNRVSFHAVPVGFMLLGASVLAALALIRRREAAA